jgi:endonuclease I
MSNFLNEFNARFADMIERRNIMAVDHNDHVSVLITDDQSQDDAERWEHIRNAKIDWTDVPDWKMDVQAFVWDGIENVNMTCLTSTERSTLFLTE